MTKYPPGTFEIPWPPSILNPNRKSHWASKARSAKKYKNDCRMMAKLASVKHRAHGDITINIFFYPPDKRRRDQDNAIASLKHGLDGIAQALGVDDYRFRIYPFWMGPVKGGKIIIET